MSWFLSSSRAALCSLSTSSSWRQASLSSAVSFISSISSSCHCCTSAKLHSSSSCSSSSSTWPSWCTTPYFSFFRGNSIICSAAELYSLPVPDDASLSHISSAAAGPWCDSIPSIMPHAALLTSVSNWVRGFLSSFKAGQWVWEELSCGGVREGSGKDGVTSIFVSMVKNFCFALERVK